MAAARTSSRQSGADANFGTGATARRTGEKIKNGSLLEVRTKAVGASLAGKRADGKPPTRRRTALPLA
jgi:hypothetical protein